jgi:hypothetical protein
MDVLTTQMAYYSSARGASIDESSGHPATYGSTTFNPSGGTSLGNAFGANQSPFSHGIEDSFHPGKDYIAPSSGFFFAAEPQRSTLIHYLPSKQVADRLLQRYWESCHLVAKVLHRPTFERQWDDFWNKVHLGNEPPPSLQALVMATLFSAVTSMEDDFVQYQFRVPKVQLLDTVQQGTESALFRAGFLRTTKLQTLQAFVMYLVRYLLSFWHCPP